MPRFITAASLTKTVKHEPYRFLLNTDFFGDLHGRDALAGRDEQVHDIQPLMERDVRPLEDGSCTNREVKLAFVATMETSLAWRDAVLTGAGWAGDALGPETAFEVDSRRFLIGKHLEQLEGADSRSAHGEGLSGGLRTARGYQPHAPLTVDAARRRLG
jgi:hypothetical protein